MTNPLTSKRRVTRDDVLQYLSTRTVVASSLGPQLDRLRAGTLTSTSRDVPAQVSRLEKQMLEDVVVIRCVDELSKYVSIRFVDCGALRTFAEKARVVEGAFAVAVLRAYYAWGPLSPERGLASVYSLLRSLRPTMKGSHGDEETTAQDFRMGRSTSERSLSASIIADAEIVLAAWIERWERPKASRRERQSTGVAFSPKGKPTFPPEWDTMPWVKAGDFAAAIGAHPNTVRLWCVTGVIPAEKRGPKLWFVHWSQLKSRYDSWIQRIREEDAAITAAQLDIDC